jgi:hypothetical protein
MPKSKTLLAMLLLMTAAAFAAPASSDGTPSSAEIKTSLRADLTLKHVVLVPEIVQPAAAPAGTVAFLKTCRCSCGQPCTTNADCGPGGACGVGITCCNRTPGQNSITAANGTPQKENLSSRKNPSIAAASDCQQK